MLIIISSIQKHFPGRIEDPVSDLCAGFFIRQTVNIEFSFPLTWFNNLKPVVFGITSVFRGCRILHRTFGKIMDALSADFRQAASLCVEVNSLSEIKFRSQVCQIRICIYQNSQIIVIPIGIFICFDDIIFNQGPAAVFQSEEVHDRAVIQSHRAFLCPDTIVIACFLSV